MLSHAREQGMTLRQFTKWIAGSSFIVAGTADSLADRMAEGYQQRAVDGFVMMPPWVSEVSDAIFKEVIPRLQNRGVSRREYSADTLRDHLGLSRPTDRG